jgi:hypothetical protein
MQQLFTARCEGRWRVNETKYVDVFGEEVVLADTVRATILQKHPEATDFIDKLGEVLAQPDEVRQSVRDERVVLYYQFSHNVFNGKWVVVVVKRIDRNFVSTLYATDKIKSGGLLWKKTT